MKNIFLHILHKYYKKQGTERFLSQYHFYHYYDDEIRRRIAHGEYHENFLNKKLLYLSNFDSGIYTNIPFHEEYNKDI